VRTGLAEHGTVAEAVAVPIVNVSLNFPYRHMSRTPSRRVGG
jgi:hypothetical protein